MYYARPDIDRPIMLCGGGCACSTSDNKGGDGGASYNKTSDNQEEFDLIFRLLREILLQTT